VSRTIRFSCCSCRDHVAVIYRGPKRASRGIIDRNQGAGGGGRSIFRPRPKIGMIGRVDDQNWL